jgi:2,3-bisphosphoglycerate-independent phosphoglycerate mutase
MSAPVLVVVLDGVGIGRRDDGDAVFLARTPTLDRLDDVALRTTLLAHGTHVGMPDDGDMGNSEVGHNALGAGRIYEQGATLVERAVRTGALFDREDDASATWLSLVDGVNERGSTLHLIGLLSDGNVHSHIEHVVALVENAANEGVSRVRLHALLDGRDVSGQSALEYIEVIERTFARLNALGNDYRIASGGGRMLVTMDRYGAEWDMVERGWNTHVLGDAPVTTSAAAAVSAARVAEPDLNDQFLPPFVVAEGGVPVGRIEDGDAVLLFNFRGDRAIELCEAFESDDFEHFDRVRRPDVSFAGMMQYDGDRGLPKNFLVHPPHIEGTMGELLARAGKKQLAVSETQKFGHVTYFWNGNRSSPFDAELEHYIEVPSDRVVFDQRPWMKAAEITDAAIEALAADPEIGFVRINYPNGDMVGHTGSLEAAILAVEATDLSLGRLLKCVDRIGAAAIVTADHGNCDQMFQVDKKTGAYAVDETGRRIPHTAHTLNPVPLWVYAPNHSYELVELDIRRLSNVAATALVMMGVEPPPSMDPSLIA